MKTIINIYFKVISVFSSKLAGNHAFQLFQKTRKSKLKKRELDFLNSTKHFTVPYHLEDIDCYETGNPNGKVVLLVHGWNSNAGSMGGIAIDLAQKGYHVFAFNLPAHGFSKQGKTNLKICKEVFLAVVERINSSKPISIVAHSFGSAVATFGLGNSRFKVDKLVFLTNPNKIEVIFKEFSKYIGLSKAAFRILTEKASTTLAQPLNEVSIEQYSHKVKYKKILLIHDYYDKILPYQNSVAVRANWSSSKMITFHKIGHYRMLWNDEVIEAISDFLEIKTIKINHGTNVNSLAS